MRLYSTPESIRQGEVSILAIFTTVLSMAVSLWIAIRWGYWWHIVIGCSIAPFVAMRTDESARRGIRDAIALNEATIDINESFSAQFAIAVAPLAILFFKIKATLIQFCSSPKACTHAVPKNLWRVTMATDFVSSPQFLPHPDDQIEFSDLILDLYDWVEMGPFTRSGSYLLRIRELCNYLWLMFFFTLLAFSYRISLKATALVWLSLILAAKPTKPATRTWLQHLQIQWNEWRPQIVAIMSFLILIPLFLKYALWIGRFELALHEDELRDFLTKISFNRAPGVIDWFVAWIRPGSFPLWHLASVVNCGLAIWFCWLVHCWLVRFKFDDIKTDDEIATYSAWIFFFRRLLSWYTSGVNLYIFWLIAQKLPVEKIGLRLFPWV